MKLLPLVLILFCASSAQIPQPHNEPPLVIGDDKDSDRLPDGKSQKEAILKADYKKNLDDAAELAKLAEDLKSDLEKNTRYVVSLQTLKKTDDIEKLAKSIRGRLKRY